MKLAGAQQALELVAAALRHPGGGLVAVEDLELEALEATTGCAGDPAAAELPSAAPTVAGPGCAVGI